MILMKRGILAIVSHPDDETFGCGGTLALHAAKADTVNVICLTCDPVERKEEIMAACEALGIPEPEVFMDQNISVDPNSIRRLSDWIVELNPRVVITHHNFDYHREHKLTYKLVKDAVEWAAHNTIYPNPCRVERLLLMEVNTLIPSPHVFIDVTPVIDKKKKAIQSYPTQLAKFPWGYYEKFNMKKSQLRGAQSNCEYAEAFLDEPLIKNSPFYDQKSTRSLL